MALEGVGGGGTGSESGGGGIVCRREWMMRGEECDGSALGGMN